MRFLFRGNFIERLGTPYASGLPCQGCKGHCGSLKRKAGISPITQKKNQKKSRRRLRRKNKYRIPRSGRIANLKHPLIVYSGQEKSLKKVCLNSCPVADLWSNCQDLENQWPKWVCGWRNTTDGIERFRNCKATCLCQDKIKN